MKKHLFLISFSIFLLFSISGLLSNISELDKITDSETYINKAREIISTWDGEKDESYEKIHFQLADKLISLKRYDAAIELILNLQKEKYNIPDINYYLAKLYYLKTNHRMAARYAKMYRSEDKVRAKEILEIFVFTNKKLYRYGPAVQALNKGVQKKIITENEYYYENVSLCYAKMGAQEKDVYLLLKKGLKNYPNNFIMLELGVKYSFLTGKFKDAHTFGDRLEKHLYSDTPDSEKINLSDFFNNKQSESSSSDKNNTKKFTAIKSLFASGRSKYQILIFNEQDRDNIEKYNIPHDLTDLKPVSLSNEDFKTFGQEILSPREGVVTYVSLKKYDHNPLQSYPFQKDNIIIIMHRLGSYSYFFNIRKDSCKLKLGDYVSKGDVIGQIGNSGRNRTPGLVYEIRTRGHFKGLSKPLDISGQ
jgi:murein DD-endopeptidase MepM/ murein hydrolase activator NlpD